MSVDREHLAAVFFNRPVLEVAEALLDCELCRLDDGGQVRRLGITEVEAYDGECDLACHASKGRTARTEIMYGPGGYWYIYLCYGIHWLLNIVTGPVDYPAAVLIRSAGEISGPGRLTKSLDITGELNRQPAVPATGLWLERRERAIPWSVHRTARIGVDYAGPDWSKRPYRFLRKD